MNLPLLSRSAINTLACAQRQRKKKQWSDDEQNYSPDIKSLKTREMTHTLSSGENSDGISPRISSSSRLFIANRAGQTNQGELPDQMCWRRISPDRLYHIDIVNGLARSVIELVCVSHDISFPLLRLRLLFAARALSLIHRPQSIDWLNID